MPLTRTLFNYNEQFAPKTLLVTTLEETVITAWGSAYSRILQRIDNEYPEHPGIADGTGLLKLTFYILKDPGVLLKHFKTDKALPYFNKKGKHLVLQNFDRKGRPSDNVIYHITNADTVEEPEDWHKLDILTGPKGEILETARSQTITLAWNKISHADPRRAVNMEKYLRPADHFTKQKRLVEASIAVKELSAIGQKLEAQGIGTAEDTAKHFPPDKQ